MMNDIESFRFPGFLIIIFSPARTFAIAPPPATAPANHCGELLLNPECHTLFPGKIYTFRRNSSMIYYTRSDIYFSDRFKFNRKAPRAPITLRSLPVQTLRAYCPEITHFHLIYH
jgi:hypothetical protein